MDHGRVCRTETTSLVHTRCRISSKDWIHPRGRISSHRRINSNGRTSFHHRISSNGRTNSRIQDRIRPLDKTMDGYLIKTHGWIISSRCCLQVLLLLLTLTSMLMFFIHFFSDWPLIAIFMWKIPVMPILSLLMNIHNITYICHTNFSMSTFYKYIYSANY